MDLYPDDGYLPGTEATVIHDNPSDGEDTFKEETSGMCERPAELFDAPPESSDHEPVRTMTERTGVADLECDRMPGRLFTSAALKNLASDGFELLVLHLGSVAVPEHTSPDHVPGMYPTLFAVGANGFDVPD